VRPEPPTQNCDSSVLQDCGAQKAGDHNYALQQLGEYESNDSEGQSDDSEGASHLLHDLSCLSTSMMFRLEQLPNEQILLYVLNKFRLHDLTDKLSCLPLRSTFCLWVQDTIKPQQSLVLG
jgi:hypothetical protein